MPEFPTPEELNPSDWDEARERIDRSLKENDVTQPYKTKLDYLETLYGLQREDGVAQLRRAVGEVKVERNRGQGDQDICVYTKVGRHGDEA
jgi:hypothetical protein